MLPIVRTEKFASVWLVDSPFPVRTPFLRCLAGSALLWLLLLWWLVLTDRRREGDGGCCQSGGGEGKIIDKFMYICI